LLEINKLDVHYGRAHVLQGVSLELSHGVLAVVGRNGMGKTTLCNAIAGLVPAVGSIRLAGEEIRGLPPHEVTRRGIGYVPQGRRLWPSLSVDEHLRLARRSANGSWTISRIYEFFPQLAERRHHGGAQLSGGEQQMLAIARALLLNPRLLVMDEPTEGLAPVIVEQVAEMLKSLAGDREIAVLLVEQNLGVAIDVADQVAVMVNGRIARRLSAQELGADRALQEQLLGVRASAEDEEAEAEAAPRPAEGEELRIYTLRRAGDETGASARTPGEGRAVRGFTRWNAAASEAQPGDRRLTASEMRTGPRDALLEGRAETAAPLPSLETAAEALAENRRASRVLEFPVAATASRAAYVAGTFDTKGRELFYLLPARLPREARPAHGDGRSRNLRQAIAGDGSPARGRAPSSGR
jgi:ABC-type branched-subunit amino acid transport system ATPase component